VLQEAFSKSQQGPKHACSSVCKCTPQSATESVDSQVVGREAHTVDRRLVVRVLINLSPLRWLRFLPHANLAIIRARGQKASKLRVRPCHLPHRPFVRRELGTQLVLCLVRGYVENLGVAVGSEPSKSDSLLQRARILRAEQVTAYLDLSVG
jgi:hypothetical protein